MTLSRSLLKALQILAALKQDDRAYTKVTATMTADKYPIALISQSRPPVAKTMIHIICVPELTRERTHRQDHKSIASGDGDWQNDLGASNCGQRRKLLQGARQKTSLSLLLSFDFHIASDSKTLRPVPSPRCRPHRGSPSPKAFPTLPV